MSAVFAALTVLQMLQTPRRSEKSRSDKRKGSTSSDSDKLKASTRSSHINDMKKFIKTAHGYSEPGPLERSTKTGGCRLPKLDLIASAWAARRGLEQHEIDAHLSEKLAADLARPFGQSTGRGFSFTQFRTHGSYSTVSMRQRDVWSPWMWPGNITSLRTLYEIGHVITHADPICPHLRWADEYPFLVPNMANFTRLDQQLSSEEEARRIATFSLPITALYGDTTPLLLESASIHKRLQCALFHKVDCMCYHSIAFGALKCCPLCDTDFAINIAPDAAPGWPDARVLVFTTWKCLGDGTKRSRYWRSHQTPAEPGSERHYGPGHAHWTYESGSCKLKHTINVPEIQRLIALARSSPKGCPPQYSPIQHA